MNRGSSQLNGWKKLQPLAAALLFAGLGNTAFAQEGRKPPKPPIILESTGAYEVGGKVVAKPGDLSQTLSCDHGYVEYFIPAKRRSVGLIMWHSSSTKVWETAGTAAKATRVFSCAGDIPFTSGTARVSVAPTGVASRSPIRLTISINATLPPGVSA
jgi:hypothetical protein